MVMSAHLAVNVLTNCVQLAVANFSRRADLAEVLDQAAPADILALTNLADVAAITQLPRRKKRARGGACMVSCILHNSRSARREHVVA
jgi:hypothetical protein